MKQQLPLRLYLLWQPKILFVPVPVLSPLTFPVVIISWIRSRYWFSSWWGLSNFIFLDSTSSVSIMFSLFSWRTVGTCSTSMVLFKFYKYWENNNMKFYISAIDTCLSLNFDQSECQVGRRILLTIAVFINLLMLRLKVSLFKSQVTSVWSP